MKKEILLTTAVCLILAGATYGYWTDQLTVNMDVSTGNFHVITGASGDASFRQVSKKDNVSDYTDYKVEHTGDETIDFTLGEHTDWVTFLNQNTKINLCYCVIPAEDASVNLFQPYETDSSFELKAISCLVGNGKTTEKLSNSELSDLDQTITYHLTVKPESDGSAIWVTKCFDLPKKVNLPEQLSASKDDGQSITIVYQLDDQTIIGQKEPQLSLFTYCLWNQGIQENGTVTVQLNGTVHNEGTDE